jgi:hypothetical protein
LNNKIDRLILPISNDTNLTKQKQQQEANIRAAHAVLTEMGARGLDPTTETMNHVLAVYAEALRCVCSLRL